MTEVRKVWARVAAWLGFGASAFAVVFVFRHPMTVGEAILSGVIAFVIVGFAGFAATASLLDALEEAGKADKKRAEETERRLKDELDRLMREEERKARG